MWYVVYFFATLWSLGCVFLPLWALGVLWSERDFGPAVVTVTIVWPICCLLSILPWDFVLDNQSPDLAVLKKDEWVCTARLNTIRHQHVCQQYNKL